MNLLLEKDVLVRDYELIIDKSGSMNSGDGTGKTRWNSAKESTIAIAHKVNELDPDGITVYTFSSSFKRYDNVNPEKVEQIFKENEPMGNTELALVLNDSLSKYFERKRQGTAKPVTILVVTDGEPSNKEDVAKVIINAANKVTSEEEIGISFIQIGKDATARAYLKSLDDDLQSKGAKFDIVNTKTFEEVEEVGIVQTLLDALYQ